MFSLWQREQTLNAQLHENLEQERRSFADDSLRDKSTVSEIQNLLEGERRKAAELHSTIHQLQTQVCISFFNLCLQVVQIGSADQASSLKWRSVV